MKISRRDLLLKEREIIMGLKTLSLDLQTKSYKYYNHEIAAIDEGSANPVYELEEGEN